MQIQAAPGPDAPATSPAGAAPVAATPASGPIQPVTDALIWVEIPANTPPGEQMLLEALDEVTGLPYNITTTELRQVDPTHFGAALRLPHGSVLRYRFVRVDASGQRVAETASDGGAIRYRLLYVDGPSEVHDIVARWQDTELQSATGRLQGLAVDAATGVGIPDLLIVAGGQHTLTRADGFFALAGLPPGTHQITAYSMDGRYQTFKQNARVAADAATPVSLQLTELKQVEVTFVVTLPEDSLPDLPLRLAGNLRPLGNTFADLGGGISGLASGMPIFTPEGDGLYRLTISLPAGSEILYKYTLGDGYWNAEQDAEGGVTLRRLVIPATARSFEVREQVEGFMAPNQAPVWFDAQVHAPTPPGDEVYIQFQLGSRWLPPLPMWPVAENRWAFALLGPTLPQETLTYRYCRNGQCGGPALATESEPDLRYAPLRNAESMVQSDHIQHWLDYNRPTFATTVLDNPVTVRPASFVAGVQWAGGADRLAEPHAFTNLNDILELKANTVVFTPGWAAVATPFPRFEPSLSNSPGWPGLEAASLRAVQLGLRPVLQPQLDLGPDPAQWWAAADRDAAWWQVWFEQYRAFALHYADFAQQQGIPILALGGQAVAPALPGGADDQPADTPQRWQRLLDEVRLRYDGQIAWVVPFENEELNPPAFLKSVDIILLEWATPLGTWEGTTLSEMHSRASQLLRQQVRPVQQELGKPFVLLAAYPSATGGLTNCIDYEGSCLPFGYLAAGQAEPAGVQLNLGEQMEVYNALLAAVNDNDWLAGFISGGYNPAVALTDTSTSVNGKPAADVLRFWFGRLLGR